MSITLELYDRARTAIGERGFDADTQTRIALFVGAASTLNVAIMAGFELQPKASVALPFVHGQYCRGIEFATLLARTTRWSPNPALYVEGATVVAPLWMEWWRLLTELSPSQQRRGAYGAIALGHALLARVRLAPAFPAKVDELDPFVVTLRRIEQEGGRMIQAQVRLLKDGEVGLDANECEAIVAAKQAAVDAAFERFLQWLAGERIETTAASMPITPAIAGSYALPFISAGAEWLRAIMSTTVRQRAT